LTTVWPLGEQRLRVIRQIHEDVLLYLTCPATPTLGEKGDEQPCAYCTQVATLRRLSTRHRPPPPAPTPWLWLAGGMLVFFLVPLVGTNMLGLQPDMYYLIYLTVAVAWFAVFVSAYSADLHDLWRHKRTTSHHDPGGRNDNQHPGQRGAASGDDEPDQVPP
jgi:hypothetical protein